MNNLEVKAKAKGKFRVQKRNVDTGEIYYDSGEFNNALLNNFFVAAASFNYCFIGTDSTVSNSDTTLTSLGSIGGKVLSVNSTVSETGVVSFDYISTFTFAAGAIIGNMSCIGLSSSPTLTGTNLKIKSLIKDVNGNPTTIPATATDQIVITHTLNIQWNQHQNLGTFVIDDVTYQADFYDVYRATSGTAAGSSILGSTGLSDQQNMGSAVYPQLATAFTPPTIPTQVSSYCDVSSGRVHLGAPQGFTHSYDSSAGTMKTNYTFTMNANTNMAANASIAAFGFTSTSNSGGAIMAVAFSPALPKNSSIAYTFTLVLTLSRA